MVPSTPDSSNGDSQGLPMMNNWTRMRAERLNKRPDVTPGGYIPCPHCGKELDLPALEREAAKRQQSELAAVPPASADWVATEEVVPDWDSSKRRDSGNGALGQEAQWKGWEADSDADAVDDVLAAGTEPTPTRTQPEMERAASDLSHNSDPVTLPTSDVTMPAPSGTVSCPQCTYGVLQTIPASFLFRAFGVLPGLEPHNQVCALCEFTSFQWRRPTQPADATATETLGEASVETSRAPREIDLSGATIDELLQIVVQQATQQPPSRTAEPIA